MKKTDWTRSFGYSGNLKSKIGNPWLGLWVFALMLVVTGVVVEAQQPTKVPRIGFLIVDSPSAASTRVEAFKKGLQELGYVEGKNITLEYRYA